MGPVSSGGSSTPRDDGSDPPDTRPPPPPTVHIPRHPFGRGQHEGSVTARVKRHAAAGRKSRHHEKLGEEDDDDDEDDEIGIHMWENRRGKLVMEVPWFRREDGGTA